MAEPVTHREAKDALVDLLCNDLEHSARVETKELARKIYRYIEQQEAKE